MPAGGYFGGRIKCFLCGEIIAADCLRFRREIVTAIKQSGRYERLTRTVCGPCAEHQDRLSEMEAGVAGDDIFQYSVWRWEGGGFQVIDPFGRGGESSNTEEGAMQAAYAAWASRVDKLWYQNLMNWIGRGYFDRDELAVLVQYARLLNIGLLRDSMAPREKVRHAFAGLGALRTPREEHCEFIEEARRRCERDGMAMRDILEGLVEFERLGFERAPLPNCGD